MLAISASQAVPAISVGLAGVVAGVGTGDDYYQGPANNFIPTDCVGWTLFAIHALTCAQPSSSLNTVSVL